MKQCRSRCKMERKVSQMDAEKNGPGKQLLLPILKRMLTELKFKMFTSKTLTDY